MQFDLSNGPLDLRNNIQTIFLEAILKSKAEKVNIIDDSIVFKSGILKYSDKRRTFFDPINKGILTLKENDHKLEVYYDLDFSQLCLITFIMSFLVSFGHDFINLKFNLSDIFVFMIGWIWLFGGIVTYTLIRLNLFIKRTVLNVIQS